MMMASGFPRALALLLSGLTLVSASANAAYPLTEAQARAIIAPFYRALNATTGDEVQALVVQATSADWVSCSGNDDLPPARPGRRRHRQLAPCDSGSEVGDQGSAGRRRSERSSAARPVARRAASSWA